MTEQLPLALRLRDSSSFGNFLAVENAEVVRRLEAAARGEVRGEQIFLWAPTACGKSHLLEACCRRAAECSRTPAYVPLAQRDRFAPDLVDGLEAVDIVCLDDLTSVAGDRRWESAIFRLYDRVRDAGGVLVAAGATSPARAEFAMPELASRIARGLVYRLVDLDDAHKGEAVRLRAAARGMSLGDDVVRFILRRHSRDLNALFALLDRIDRASLAEQRRITVPLIKKLLDET